MGADLAGGLLAMQEIERVRKEEGARVSLVFKDVHGEFLRRADSDVDFACEDGAAARETVRRAVATRERQETPLDMVARCGDEDVARFRLTLSLKAR